MSTTYNSADVSIMVGSCAQPFEWEEVIYMLSSVLTCSYSKISKSVRNLTKEIIIDNSDSLASDGYYRRDSRCLLGKLRGAACKLVSVAMWDIWGHALIRSMIHEISIHILARHYYSFRGSYNKHAMLSLLTPKRRKGVLCLYSDTKRTEVLLKGTKVLLLVCA